MTPQYVTHVDPDFHGAWAMFQHPTADTCERCGVSRYDYRRKGKQDADTQETDSASVDFSSELDKALKGTRRNTRARQLLDS